MIKIADRLRDDTVRMYFVESKEDRKEAYRFARDYIGQTLAFDTESTGLDPYKRDWQLRLFQFGNDVHSYVIPASMRGLIDAIFNLPINWVGFNSTHDVRSIDQHLGYRTYVDCDDAYIPGHYYDTRSRDQGGVGHKLEELSEILIDATITRWEKALKREFKKIRIEVGGIHDRGPKKGEPKTRIALMSEGWGLINLTNKAYITYAGADPMLTYRLWYHPDIQAVLKDNAALYQKDLETDRHIDIMQRRGVLLDVDYTTKLDRRFTRETQKAKRRAAQLGCANINSPLQLAGVLTDYGVQLTERTPKGQWQVTDKILRRIQAAETTPAEVVELIQCVMTARQCGKRQSAYTRHMLDSRDHSNRIHASINALAARTARMSVSNPAFQQLPTKEGSIEND